ncbi:MAG: type IV secretory system conjugative DNA transfer family protein [Bacilli bacterium]|nr:type IV secretory system conjugative DNA transfer family protein [Bacilli bacterium]
MASSIYNGKSNKKGKLILWLVILVFMFALGWAVGVFALAFYKMGIHFQIERVPEYLFELFSLICGAVTSFAMLLYIVYVKLTKKNKGPRADRADSNLYDDSRFLTKKELDEKYGIQIGKNRYAPVLLKNIKDNVVNGLVINSGLTSSGDYYFHRTSNVHSIVVGTTGTGKTKFMLIPTVLMMAKSSNKPSMIVIDIKGEIIEKTYNTLNENGYDIHIVDFRRPEVSEKYNPLGIIIDYYDRYMEDPIKNVEAQYHYDKEINHLAELICPSDKSADAFWATAGQGIFKAIVYGMLEDYEKDKSLPEYERTFTKEKFTFSTIAEINRKGNAQFFNYWFTRPLNSKARKLAQSQILSNYERGVPNKTLLSILSTYTTAFDKFVDTASIDLTIKSDFDACDIKRKATALFLLLPDEDRSKYPLASLIINQAYSLLVLESQKTGFKNTRDVHLILDEFANLPRISEIDNWLSVGRERKLFISIFIQAVSQLEDKYGKDFAKTIIQNCNMKIILGLGEPGSIDYFKHFFGTYTIVSTSSSQGERDNSGSSNRSFNKADLITSSQFMNMKPGEIYFLELKQHPGHTNILPIFDEKFQKLLNLKEYALDQRQIYAVSEQTRNSHTYIVSDDSRVPDSKEQRQGFYNPEEPPKVEEETVKVDGQIDEPVPQEYEVGTDEDPFGNSAFSILNDIEESKTEIGDKKA